MKRRAPLPNDPTAFNDYRILREWLRTAITEVVREEATRLLSEGKTLSPLLSIDGVAKILSVSKRTCETLVADGQIRPIWIKGQRRFHPEAIDAFLRTSAAAKSRRD